MYFDFGDGIGVDFLPLALKRELCYRASVSPSISGVSPSLVEHSRINISKTLDLLAVTVIIKPATHLLEATWRRKKTVLRLDSDRSGGNPGDPYL